MLGGASFLSAVDLHAAEPRATSAVMIVLYAVVVLTTVLQLPTDISLSVGLDGRRAALETAMRDANAANLSATSGSPMPVVINATTLEEGGGPFSTALSAQQFGFVNALIAVRALFALFAWSLSCLLQSAPAFDVPPVLVEESTTRDDAW